MSVDPNNFGLWGFQFPVGGIAPPDVTGDDFSPADVIRWLIVWLNLGVTPSTRVTGVSWPVCVGLEPSAPDDCITVKNTQGQDDGRSMPDSEANAHYGLQVRVRSVDENIGWRKANAVRTALATQVRMTHVVIGSHEYNVVAVTRIGQVIAIGKETPASKRNVFTLNVMAAIKQVT